jgi:lipopolysaccharide transport system ATP-binding protein
MSVAIKVEALGKKYILRHQTGGRSRYVALRDVLADKVTSLFKRNSQADGRREEFWALKDISFEIKQGEAVGIIGRNGAGKSTLLKLLSRITKPTQGRIEIEGRVASLLEVGTGFHPELTGRENIYLNGAIMGMHRAEIKSKFDEIVAFAEVEKFLDTPVKRYSSGMYMRLAFAVAAHLEPEILVVDEVLAVGDAAFQKKCLGKMQDVSQKQGRTVLFVSHNMEAIIRLCSQCVYLAQGELKAQGGTREVIKAYTEHAKQTGAKVDLTKLPRRFEGNGSAQLRSLNNLNNSSGAAWCYEYGTPLEFSVEFSVSKKLENPEIGFAILSSGGTELVGVTTSQESPIEELTPGRYVMKVAVPDLCLNPGTYTLALGIAVSGRSADHILEATQIEIIPSRQSIEKELHKIWAPITPHTIFELNAMETNLQTIQS